ncbi:MAG: lambda exonuclease family protein [Shewanella sp.]
MITINCRQGTDEWLQARSGVITASRFEDAVNKLKRKSGDKEAGESSLASDKYCADVSLERIYGKPFQEPARGWALDRGHKLEDACRIRYQEQTGSIVTSSGLVLTDDRRFGYSTDGLVDDDGLLEVKCPVDSLKILSMLTTLDPSEYIHQIQGGLWITGRQWCDLVMYAPMLESVGNDLIILRIKRDEQFIDAMVKDLLIAMQTVDRMVLAFSKPQIKEID